MNGKTFNMVILDDALRGISTHEIQAWARQVISPSTFDLKTTSGAFRDIGEQFERLSYSISKIDARVFEPTFVAIYNDPRFPDCTVRVDEKSLSKNDPRNPNPAAGPVRQFEITYNGKTLTEPTRTIARKKAQAIHERLLAVRIEEVRKTLPANFGRF